MRLGPGGQAVPGPALPPPAPGSGDVCSGDEDSEEGSSGSWETASEVDLEEQVVQQATGGVKTELQGQTGKAKEKEGTGKGRGKGKGKGKGKKTAGDKKGQKGEKNADKYGDGTGSESEGDDGSTGDGSSGSPRKRRPFSVSALEVLGGLVGPGEGFGSYPLGAADVRDVFSLTQPQVAVKGTTQEVKTERVYRLLFCLMASYHILTLLCLACHHQPADCSFYCCLFALFTAHVPATILFYRLCCRY